MPNPQRYDEFAGLVRLSTNQILSYINALLLNWNDAEDVFQETCVVLWRKFDEFQPGTNFLGWALRIAQHKVMDFQKTKSRRVAFHAGLRDSLLNAVAKQDTDTAAAGLSALSDCAAELPGSDRELVMRCYGEGVPVRQVADDLGRSPQSVHNSLSRIRKLLLECVERHLRRTTGSASASRLPTKEDGR